MNRWSFKQITLKPFTLAFIFALFSGIFLRLSLYLNNPSFWLDEAFLGVNICDKNYLDFFKPLDFEQVAPPLFLIFSKFLYGLICENLLAVKDLALRFLSFVSSVGAVLFFGFFCQKMYKNKNFTLVATSILLFNPCAIRYSAEFKQYSFEMLVNLILIYIFYSSSEKMSKKRMIFYSLFLALSVWASNSAFFVLIGGFILLFYKRIKNKNFKTPFLVLFTPCFLSFVVFYFGYYFNVSNKLYNYMSRYWTIFDPSFFNFSNFYKMFQKKTLEFLPFYKPFLYPLFLINFLILFKNKKIFVLIFTPIFFAIMLSFLKIYPYEQRLLLPILPCFILFFCQIFSTVKSNKFYDFSLSLFVIYISFLNLNLSAKERLNNEFQREYMEKSYARELTEILFRENPELTNLYACGMAYNYYSYHKYGKVHCTKAQGEKFLKETIIKDFEKYDDNEYIWLLFTDSNTPRRKIYTLQNYIIKNYKNVQIWQSPYYRGDYLLKFKKGS